jgi:hypothetical protein
MWGFIGRYRITPAKKHRISKSNSYRSIWKRFVQSLLLTLVEMLVTAMGELTGLRYSRMCNPLIFGLQVVMVCTLLPVQ